MHKETYSVKNGVYKAINTRLNFSHNADVLLRSLHDAVINLHEHEETYYELILMFTSLSALELSKLTEIFDMVDVTLFGGIAENSRYLGIVEVSGYIQSDEANLLRHASDVTNTRFS